MSTTMGESALRETVLELAGQLVGGERARSISLERPPRSDFGDYSTNAALLLAPAAGVPPRELARRLGQALADRLGGQLERYEVAGPGFLNLFLADGWHRAALAQVLAAGDGYGCAGADEPERVLVEFVSANPTGPMHVGHARNAAYGDALARVLAFHGHRVEREFYVNDAGSQVLKLGASIAALARGDEVPEDGYRGDYVPALVVEVQELLGVQSAAKVPHVELGAAAVRAMVARMQASLGAFRVRSFDCWSYESILHEPREDLLGPDGAAISPVEHALSLLEQSGHTYRRDGALWLRSSEFGDDKDRVLVRSSGEHTYFASDIAYHQDKRERGFDRQIDVWGADHHGYMARMKAAYEALGGDPSHLEMLIMQLVHLLRRGERAQMSKRSGEFVTLDDLVGEIGVDAARWYLLSRSHDTTIDLDLDLAVQQSSENPVYYVQYAHARIASMLERAGASRVDAALAQMAEQAGSDVGMSHGGQTGVRAGEDANTSAGGPGSPPVDARAGRTGCALDVGERALIKELLAYPGEVREAAARRAPHRIATYALLLAQTFTAFYRDCRVVGVEPEAVESRRLALCVATKRTIASALELLGVSAPAQM